MKSPLRTKPGKEDALHRLLRNAALAKPAFGNEIGAHLRTRILAAWRGAPDEDEALLRMLRKALIASAAVSLATVVWALAAIESEPADSEQEIMALLTNSPQAIELSWIQSEVGRQSGVDTDYR